MGILNKNYSSSTKHPSVETSLDILEITFIFVENTPIVFYHSVNLHRLTEIITTFAKQKKLSFFYMKKIAPV